jgi:hypothetical protein
MMFSDTAGCPQFCPNQFKADMCVDCQNKIQAHAGATDKQVRVFCKNIVFPQTPGSKAKLPSFLFSPDLCISAYG